MKKLLLVILLIIITLLTAACQVNVSEEDIVFGEKKDNKVTFKVTRVVDGDTIIVANNNRTERVRLIGVNTPETVHPTKDTEPFGQEAGNFTKSRLAGKEVILEFDVQLRDKYGRLLAYVWLDGEMFNETLVREGYAQVATYPPNVKYAGLFLAAQEEARENNRGLWGRD